MATYRVLAGISYPPNKRAEVGDVVDDLPSRSIKWLAEAGAIEMIDSPKPKAKKVEPKAADEFTPTYFDDEEVDD